MGPAEGYSGLDQLYKSKSGQAATAWLGPEPSPPQTYEVRASPFSQGRPDFVSSSCHVSPSLSQLGCNLFSWFCRIFFTSIEA